jgi:hypothetical protein
MEYKSVFSLFNHIYCFFLLIVVKIVNFVNETIRKGTKKALRMTERFLNVMKITVEEMLVAFYRVQ